MAKCGYCHVEILDETEVCPLCRSVLEPSEAMENMYPDVRTRIKGMRLASRIYLFCAILAFCVLLGINLYRQPQIFWSAPVGLVLFYGYLILRYAIAGKTGYRGKIMVLAFLAVLLAVASDFVVGYRGWSVDYVLPGGILAVDGIVLGCMVCNPRRWYSYLMWQLLMILCALIPGMLYLAGWEHNALMAFLPLALSAAIFAGTMIIGGHQAWQELVRRFHF